MTLLTIMIHTHIISDMSAKTRRDVRRSKFGKRCIYPFCFYAPVVDAVKGGGDWPQYWMAACDLHKDLLKERCGQCQKMSKLWPTQSS